MKATLKVLTALVASFILISIIVIQSSPVKAQVKTIVVPDDYLTLNDAIGNSTNGDTILVRNGNYQEHTLTITKSLTIVGEDKTKTQITNIDNHVWNQAIQTLPPVTYAINVTASNVKITGFTLAQASIAIYTNGNDITLAGLNIPYGEVMLNGSNQTFAHNTISGFTSDVVCTGSNNYLLHNNVDGGLNRGILAKGSNNVFYDNKITAYNLIYTNGTNTNLPANSFIVWGDSNFLALNSLKDSSIEIRGNTNTVSGNLLENGHFGSCWK